MKKQTLLLAFVAMILASYVAVMPGCGNNSTSPQPTSYYNCQPGQICTGPNNIPVAQGIPLIQTPTMSFLDPGGASNIVLTYAAPNVVAGQPYAGPVNISGILHLAPGACPGPYMNGGDFQVVGQGQWVSGYAGSVAGVQGSLQVNGGAGGQVSFQPALVRATNINGYAYVLSYGPGLWVSFCNYLFAFYNM